MIVSKTLGKSGPLLQSTWQPVLRTAKIGGINRILGILVRLVSIPLLINHLGMERYGVWLTIASFSYYVMILDFGVSSSLVNKLTCFYAASDLESAEAHVACALITIGVITTCCAALCLATVPFIDWVTVLKLSSNSIGRETVWAMTIALLFYFVQLPLAVVQKVPYAMQCGWINEKFQIAGLMVSFVGTLMGIYAGAGLASLVFFLAGSSTFATLALLFYLVVSGKFRLILPDSLSLRKFVTTTWKSGLDYMLIQTVFTLMVSLQFTLIATYLGAETVAPYGLMTQVLLVLQIPFSVLQQPMWTRMAQLVFKADFATIKRMLLRYVKYAFIYSIITSLVIIFLVNPITAIVLHKVIFFPLDLRIGFAMACALALLSGGGIGTVLLALNLSRPMALCGVLQLAIFLCCAIVFVPYHGTVAMILSVCATYIIGLPFSFWLIRKELHERMRKSPDFEYRPV